MTSLAEWNAPGQEAPKSLLARIVAILDAIKEAGGCLCVTDIAMRTGLPKSTVSRLVADLIAQRYLGRSEDGIVLGLRLFELGSRASLPRRLIAAATPVIRQLFEITGERVVLWMQQGTDMVSLAAVPGSLPSMPTTAGMRSPALTTASGKAYLAFCADERVVDRVSAPLVEPAAHRFRDELAHVRAASLAVDIETSYPGVAAVASPVLSFDRVVLGAISLAGPSDRMDPQGLAPLVRAAGSRVTRILTAA